PTEVVPGVVFHKLAVASRPGGGAFAVDDGDDRIRLFDASGAGTPVPERFEGGVECLALSEDGTRVAAGGGGGRLRVWSVARAGAGFRAAPEVRDKLNQGGGSVSALRFSPSGRLAAAVGDTIHLDEPGGPGVSFRTGLRSVRSLAFSDDSRWLA